MVKRGISAYPIDYSPVGRLCTRVTGGETSKKIAGCVNTQPCALGVEFGKVFSTQGGGAWWHGLMYWWIHSFALYGAWLNHSPSVRLASSARPSYDDLL